MPLDRIDGVRPGEHAGLVLRQFGPVEVALAAGLFAITGDGVLVFRRREAIGERMLRRDDHVRCTVQSVGAGRVDPQDIVARLAGVARRCARGLPCVELVVVADVEVDFGTGRTSDPVALQGLDARRPVEAFEVLFQAVGIGRDPQHPLTQWHAHDGVIAALAQAVDHLFVGQDRAKFGAPVDRCFALVCKAEVIPVGFDGIVAFGLDVVGDRQLGDRSTFVGLGVVPGVEELQEDELRPAEIVNIGRCQFAFPVVAEAEHLELASERVGVLLGREARMRARLLCMLLGGQSEGVPTHRVHDALAKHPVIATDDIGRRVAFGVADVQAVATRVGEHIEHVHLLAVGQARSAKRFVLFPKFLPLAFDDCRVVSCHGSLPSFGWSSEDRYKVGVARGASLA